MRATILHLNNLSVLIPSVVLVFAFPICAQTTGAFSFDRALQIYNDVSTASQLSDYLKTASEDDQKDYRYTLYRIRGYYASYQFPEGDALVDSGLAVAQTAGLTNAQMQRIKADLQKQRDYWEYRYSMTQPSPSASPSISTAGSGGNSKITTVIIVHSGSKGTSITAEPQEKAKIPR